MRDGRFVLLNAPGGGPKTVGQAEAALPDLRKILRIGAVRPASVAKWRHLQSEVVRTPIQSVMANDPLFHGFC